MPPDRTARREADVADRMTSTLLLAVTALFLLVSSAPFETHAQSTTAVRGEVTFHDNKVKRAEELTFQTDPTGNQAFWLYARLGRSGTPETESSQRIPIETIKTIEVTTQRSAIRTSVTLRDGRVLDGWNWLTDTVNIREKFPPLSLPHQLSTIRKITFD
jgi:hypothetical protein